MFQNFYFTPHSSLLTLPSSLLPSSPGSSAAKAAATKTAATEAATRRAPTATTSEEEGREPVIIIATTAPLWFWLGMVPAQCGKHPQNQRKDRMPETKRKDKNAKPNGEVIIVFTRVYVVPVDRCLAGLELTVQGFYGRENCGIKIILLHIPNDARPGNVIALHIREISLQSFSRGYKIPTVIYRNDNHQATPRLLVAYSLLIANILRHA